MKIPMRFYLVNVTRSPKTRGIRRAVSNAKLKSTRHLCNGQIVLRKGKFCEITHGMILTFQEMLRREVQNGAIQIHCGKIGGPHFQFDKEDDQSLTTIDTQPTNPVVAPKVAEDKEVEEAVSEEAQVPDLRTMLKRELVDIALQRTAQPKDALSRLTKTELVELLS